MQQRTTIIQYTLIAIISLITGVVLTLTVTKKSTPNGLEYIKYFDVRNTATNISTADPVKTCNPILNVGSQEIAFYQGNSTVRIYLISLGKKELLHNLEINADWFRSIWFTTFQKESGSIGILLTAKSHLKSSELRVIPDGYDKYPSLFDRHWEYDLGKLESLTTHCNFLATNHPQWQLASETASICYQISRDNKEFQRLAKLNNLLAPSISEIELIDSTKEEKHKSFILVTVEVNQ